MTDLYVSEGIFPHALLDPTVQFIKKHQQVDGAIPWYTGGKLDPWDHTEAAMGLSIAGEIEAAYRAYNWLRENQLADGSWWAYYFDGDQSTKRETNFIAYPATGVWHYFLITGDHNFLREFFPMVEEAIDFVLQYQSSEGEIYWSVLPTGEAERDALITACSSILRSLECACHIATTLNKTCDHWRQAYISLKNALLNKPQRFDRTWESKARYSMDWFYPILGGACSRAAAKRRLEQRWSVFIAEHLGCRCVSDHPWITVAESCELTLALIAAGEVRKAMDLYSWLHQWRDTDGGYWTGYVFADKVIWPREKTTWTAAAILLAADALTQHTPAAFLFTEQGLVDSEVSNRVELL